MLLLEQFHQRTITYGTITAFIAKELLIQQGQNLATNRKNCFVLEINEWGVGEGQVMVTE